MKQTTLSFGIIFASSLLLAGCSLRGSTTTSTTQAPSQTMSEAAKFSAAIQSGSPTTCTITKGTELSMEYVIKGKTMRANTTNTVTDKDGKVTKTIAHMINDGQVFYVWTDGQKQGTKMVIPSPNPSASPEGAVAKNTTPSLASEADYQKFQDQGYAINCKAGSADPSVFTPPADIKFIDPSEIMKQVAVPGKVPSGVDIQKLQQQYANNY